MHDGILASWAAGGNDPRYCVGVMPNIRRKLVVNEPALLSPTARQMRITDQSVDRRSAAARSKRRVNRY